MREQFNTRGKPLASVSMLLYVEISREYHKCELTHFCERMNQCLSPLRVRSSSGYA
jgi:hypothetical protein